MILQELGRWRSVPSPEEFQDDLTDILSKLTDEEMACVEHILQELEVQQSSPLADQVAELEWDEVPVPIAEWLEEPDLVGDTGKTLFPVLKRDMIELFEGNYHEVILTGSIGWGKDYFATTAMMRILYELCCLKDPGRTLGLGAGEPLHIVPISRTVAAAKRVVFGGITKKLMLAPWFRGRFKDTMDYIEFPKKNIMIVGGASGDAAALGLNVYASIVDEADFMGQVTAAHRVSSAAGQTASRAQMIYDVLTRRVKSRFKRSGVRGMVFLISSKRATTDFTETRIRTHLQQGTTAGVFVRDYATWHVKPEAFADQEWHRCSVSPSEGKCRVLEKDESAPEDALVFEFPADYLDEFQRDPAGATRDVAGIATDAYAPFFSKRVAIETMMDENMVSPFPTKEWEPHRPLDIRWGAVMGRDARGVAVPLCCPHAPRHVAIDLSKNLCATGFTLAHQCGIAEVIRRDPETGRKTIEEAPDFHVDGVLRIVAPASGEIDHAEVRGLIVRLSEGGYNVRSVSMDHWMSVPNMQLLKKRGFRVEEISTVKKIAPYACLRSAIYEERVKCPEFDLLRQELRALELDPKAPPHRPKVICGEHSTKDLSDSLASAIFYLSNNSTYGHAMGVQLGESVPDGPVKPRWKDGDVIFPDEEGYGETPDPQGNGSGGEPWGHSWIL